MTVAPIDYTTAFEEIVVHEDVTIPCECAWHERTKSVGDAQWVVWTLPMCHTPAAARLWCNDCLIKVLSSERHLRCPQHNVLLGRTPKEFIVGYERLDRS
jgi:hypothetical protein